MLYVTNDNWNVAARHNAGNKAREDVFRIARSSGFLEFNVPVVISSRSGLGIAGKISEHLELCKRWKQAMSSMKKGDVLLVQYPLIHRTVFFYRVLRYAASRGVITILLIHDLDILRLESNDGFKRRFAFEQKRSLKAAGFLVSHNAGMTRYLVESLSCKSEQIVNLDLFDYCFPKTADNGSAPLKDGAVVIAGNLAPQKAGYIHSLPKDVTFALYGVGLDEPVLAMSNIEYRGKFEPDSGPNIIAGSWGLVWDGDSSETCSGTYGEYLRVNNPHKTSLYLAAGLPVIVWSGSALAPFVLENGLGLAVDSLFDIKEAIGSLNDEEYAEMRANAMVMSKKLRSGYFTKRALAEVGNRIGCEDLAQISLETE